MEVDFESRTVPSFGVAGNFTGHLEQAGEARDFTNIKTKEVNAPKALFPTFIPKGIAPDFLQTFPFSDEKIIFPEGEEKLQIEPECAVLCRLVWNGEYVSEVKPLYFGASNDCSIRKEGAKKISIKKNWGSASKGFSKNRIKIDNFTNDGCLERYRIASFLVRDSSVFDYGEDSAVRDYSYIYEKLCDWILEKLNFQKDEGPAENVHSYLLGCDRPDFVMVSIGATRYTSFGEHNFLQNGDRAVVVLYPEDKYSHDQIKDKVIEKDYSASDISFLDQVVVV